MKFIADVMLGRLARLMRFCGYDVEYDRHADDTALLRRSRYRILLTKDRQLSNRVKKNRVYQIASVGGENQLREIQKKFPLRPAQDAARCLLCNRKIRRISKRRIQHLVPPFVYQKYRTFYTCPECKRIYWQGTHFEGMSRVLE